MPSTRDIVLGRQRFAAMLPDVATIRRGTETTNEGGSQETVWATLAEDVPCRLSPVGGGEDAVRRRGGDRVADEATAVITFAWDQDVAETDTIEIDGQAFDVQLVRKRGQYAMTKRVEVREP